MASKNVPTNKALYSRVKAAAKKKFKVYPSAYANTLDRDWETITSSFFYFFSSYEIQA
jgi:hypothetical protein